MPKKELTNSDIAELLAREAESAKHPLQRAFRRASRSAFLWSEEAAELVRRNQPLTTLEGVGPFLEKLLRKWVADPPLVPKADPLREHFFTWTKAQTRIVRTSVWTS